MFASAGAPPRLEGMQIMSDADKPAVQPTPAPGSTSAYPKAKIGQDDTGHVVTSAGDEPMSGTVADITDGDTHKKKHK